MVGVDHFCFGAFAGNNDGVIFFGEGKSFVNCFSSIDNNKVVFIQFFAGFFDTGDYFIDNALRVFGPGIFVGQYYDIGVIGNCFSHDGTFAAIAIAGGAENGDNPAGGDRFYCVFV